MLLEFPQQIWPSLTYSMGHWLLRAGKTNPRKSRENSNESKLGPKADLEGGETGAKIVRGAKREIHIKPHWKSNLYAESMKLVLNTKIVIKWIFWECATQSDSRKKRKKRKTWLVWWPEKKMETRQRTVSNECPWKTGHKLQGVRKENWRIHFYTVTKIWETEQRWQIHANNKFNLVMQKQPTNHSLWERTLSRDRDTYAHMLTLTAWVWCSESTGCKPEEENWFPQVVHSHMHTYTYK